MNDKPYSKYARKRDRQLGAVFFYDGVRENDEALAITRRSLTAQRLGEFNAGYYAAKRAWEERNVK